MKYLSDTELKALIEGIREGDEKALDRFCEAYSPFFNKIVFSITKGKIQDPMVDTKDWVQEFMIFVLEKIFTFQGESSFETWVYKVCSHKFIDWIRKRRKDITNLEDLAGEDIENIPDGKRASNPIDEMLIDECIEKLPKEKQAVIKLKYFQGYVLEEIATILNIPVGTAISRYNDARKKLFQCLKIELSF